MILEAINGWPDRKIIIEIPCAHLQKEELRVKWNPQTDYYLHE